MKDIKEICGELLISGFRGALFSEDSDLARDLKEFHLGGVILFDKDMLDHQPVHNITSVEQTRKLCSDIQNFVERPVFISIDQEGGLVNRLKADYGFPETRSHLKLGRLNNLEETYQEGVKIARTLSDAGINLNFAPVVDLDLNEVNPIIHKKERSFGSSSEIVISHANAYIKAHQEQGVLTTLKHFPGHGSSFDDSHLGFTDTTETWQKEELLPYSSLIQAGYDECIMTTHIFNAQLDDTFPATLSYKTLTTLLREELAFKGLIISDDMQMKAITDKFGLETAVITALKAGVDILCFGNNLSATPVNAPLFCDMIERGILRGDLSKSLIYEKYERIQHFKMSKLS